MPKIYVNNNYFSNQNSNMAYLLGFISADGNVSSTNNRLQIQLSIKDYEFLCQIQNEIGGCEVYEYTSNNHLCCGWYCYSSQIKKDLTQYGIIPKKTGTLSLPSNLKKEFIIDYIRGYFDGDGCISKDNGIMWRITSANREILEDISEFFNSKGIKKTKILFDSRGKGSYILKYRSQASIDIYNLLYYDGCFCLPRKKEKYIKIMKEKYNSKRLRNFPKEVE